MSKIKVLLVGDDDNITNKIKQYFSSHVVIEVREVAYDGDNLSLNLKGEKNTETDIYFSNLEVSITKILHELGIPSHIKGYNFIKEGISLIYYHPNLSITKDLYPIIANKYSTTSYCVERAIRHAIETSWNRANIDFLEEVFGYSIDIDKAKATNSEFIITLANKIKMDNYI